MKGSKTDARHTAATISAIVAFAIGWGLTIAGFIVPPMGEVSGSVLAVLGEAMVYAASVFGVTLYFNSRLQGFQDEARRYLDQIRGTQEPIGFDDNHDAE